MGSDFQIYTKQVWKMTKVQQNSQAKKKLSLEMLLPNVWTENIWKSIECQREISTKKYRSSHKVENRKYSENSEIAYKFK